MSSGAAATVLGPPTCGVTAFNAPGSSVALVCARRALPVVAASRQQVLAGFGAGVLTDAGGPGRSAGRLAVGAGTTGCPWPIAMIS